MIKLIALACLTAPLQASGPPTGAVSLGPPPSEPDGSWRKLVVGTGTTERRFPIDDSPRKVCYACEGRGSVPVAATRRCPVCGGTGTDAPSSTLGRWRNWLDYYSGAISMSIMLAVLAGALWWLGREALRDRVKKKRIGEAKQIRSDMRTDDRGVVPNQVPAQTVLEDGRPGEEGVVLCTKCGKKKKACGCEEPLIAAAVKVLVAIPLFFGVSWKFARGVSWLAGGWASWVQYMAEARPVVSAVILGLIYILVMYGVVSERRSKRDRRHGGCEGSE